MTGPGAHIRPAEPADAPALGRLHVRAWQAAYRGIMPDEFLDGLDPTEREQRWARSLAQVQPGVDSTRLVVCADSGDPVGFAIVGRVRDQDASRARLGELYALNLDPDVWGHGIGKKLLAVATAELARLGFVEAVLWVVTGNVRARRFYEAAGWTADGTARTDESFGPAIDEVRYRRSLSEADS